MLVGDILRANARSHFKTIGLIDSASAASFPYGEINARANRLSNGLADLGLVKGDRVAVLLPNNHQFVEVYFALAKAGYVIVPINIVLSSSEAALIIRQSEASACIFGESTEGTVRGMIREVPTVKHFVTTGRSSTNVDSYEALLAASSDAEPVVAIADDDVAMIMYTSGSTSVPKGVVSTHRNIVSNTNTMVLELRIVPEDRTLLFMPMFHNGGLWPLMTHFYRAATVVIEPRFQEVRVLQGIAAHRITVLNVVPTMLTRLLAHPDFAASDLSSLRLIMHGGGPIKLDLLKDAMKIIGPSRFYTSLGSTEANGMLTSFPTNEHALEGPLSAKLASVGHDAVGIEIKIVDDDGREVGCGETGEIVARGANISPGYWNMPEESAATFRDGWLHVGDMAYRDDDGFIFIVGRKKDIIISGGENISSLEVEQVIAQHPAVRDVAVIGMPDDKWGEAVMALINLQPDGPKVDEQELLVFCSTRLAAFKRPKVIRFVDDFPRTSIGKVAKGELRKLYLPPQ